MSPPEPVRARRDLFDSDDEGVDFLEVDVVAAAPPQIVPVCCLSLYEYVFDIIICFFLWLLFSLLLLL